MGFQAIPGTSREIELGFRLSFLWVVNIILVIHLVRALPHSECAAIAEVVKKLQEMGRCCAVAPSKKIPLRPRDIGLLEVIRQSNNFPFPCLCSNVQGSSIRLLS